MATYGLSIQTVTAEQSPCLRIKKRQIKRSNPAVTTAGHPILGLLGVDCSLRSGSLPNPQLRNGSTMFNAVQRRKHWRKWRKEHCTKRQSPPPTQQDRNSNSIKFQHLAPAKNFQCRVSLLAIKSVRPILRA